MILTTGVRYDNTFPLPMKNNYTANTHILTEKDVKVLSLVYYYDGVSTELILRAFYPTPSARSYAYSRLNRLVLNGYLSRLRLPSLTGVGSGQAFFTLGLNGRKAVAHLLGIPRTSLLRQEMALGLPFINHHPQTCATRLTITQATSAPNSPATLIEWRTEREIKARPFKVRTKGNQEHILIPDAYFALRTQLGDQAAFCLETDMGTLSKRRWAEKIALYSQSPHPAVLVTVPGAKRKEELLSLTIAAVKEQRADASRFWFANTQDLNHNTILTEPVWSIPGIGISSLMPTSSYDAQKSNHNALKTTAYSPAIINVSTSSSGGGDP